MDENPYQSPVEFQREVGEARAVRFVPAVISTTKRGIAIGVFSLPLLLAIPVRYWAFNVAGSWFVSTDIDPDQRSMNLGLMYLLVMAAIAAASIFPGLLLLFIDNYRRTVTGCLMVPALICFVLALLVFASMVDAYYRFS